MADTQEYVHEVERDLTARFQEDLLTQIEDESRALSDRFIAYCQKEVGKLSEKLLAEMLRTRQHFVANVEDVNGKIDRIVAEMPALCADQHMRLHALDATKADLGAQDAAALLAQIQGEESPNTRKQHALEEMAGRKADSPNFLVKRVKNKG